MDADIRLAQEAIGHLEMVLGADVGAGITEFLDPNVLDLDVEGRRGRLLGHGSCSF